MGLGLVASIEGGEGGFSMMKSKLGKAITIARREFIRLNLSKLFLAFNTLSASFLRSLSVKHTIISS